MAITTLDVRVTIYSPKMDQVIALDASGDCAGGYVEVNEDPTGCGAGTFVLGRYRPETVDSSRWGLWNVVEVSEVAAIVTTSFAAGATKIYVETYAPFDPNRGEPGQQAFFWDGGTLTMRVPVTGMGTDGGGNYITVGTPLAGGGNPTTLPAYVAGVTVVGARRYVGCVMRRSQGGSRPESMTITTAGLSIRLDRTIDNMTVNAISNTDSGAALASLLQRNASRWPMLTVDATAYPSTTFPATGLTFTGTYTKTKVSQIENDIVAAANSSGNVWSLVNGHDRKPRLRELFVQGTNAYTFPVTLARGQVAFDPRALVVQDDATNSYNSVEVDGDTNPATKQPYSAIAQDAASITAYGQLDQTPTSNTSLKSDAGCAAQAEAGVNQNGIASQQISFTVSTRTDDSSPTNQPAGAPRGIVVRGVSAVTITGNDDTGSVLNDVPDSDFQYPSGAVAAWTTSGGTVTELAGVISSSNGFQVPPSSSAGGVYRYSQPIAVAQGEVRTLSGYINASTATSNPPCWAVLSPDLAIAVGYVYATNGQSGIWTGKIQIPANYAYDSVVVIFLQNGSVPGSSGIIAAQPMLQRGGFASPYIANFWTPNITGLVTNVKTRWEPGRDATQQVQMRPIVPDWNAAAAEMVNASQAAILANTTPNAYLDQYVVSATAFPRTTAGELNLSVAGLRVSPPSFLALFALGTTAITVPATTHFDLPASSNAYAWLNPNGTWTVNTTSATVSGSILYAFFTTGKNNSGADVVMGQWSKASVGVFITGTATLALMPATVLANGPTIISASVGAPTATGGATTTYPVTVHFGEWTTAPPPNWLDDILVLQRTPTTHNAIASPQIKQAASTDGPTYTIPVEVPAGLAPDIGFTYVDHNNQQCLSSDTFGAVWPSSCYQLGGQSAPQISPPTGIAGSSNINYASDSNFDFGLTYWPGAGATPAIYPPQGPPYKYLAWSGTGPFTGSRYSQPISVTTQKYCFTVETGHIRNAGAAYYGIVAMSDYTANNVTPATVLAVKEFDSDLSTNEDISITWDNTSGSYSQVALCLWVVGFSGTALYQIPQFEVGTSYSGYKPGSASLTATSTTSAGAASYATGTTVEALKPAQVGADVTGANTALDTANVNSVPAAVYSQRSGLSFDVTAAPPYVDSSNVLHFQSIVRITRGDGTRCAIPTSLTATLNSTNSGVVFVQWVSGTASTLVAINLGATGAAGTGFTATMTSPLYEVVGSWRSATQCKFFLGSSGTDSSLIAATANIIVPDGAGNGTIPASTALNKQGSMVPTSVPAITLSSSDLSGGAGTSFRVTNNSGSPSTPVTYSFTRADGSTFTASLNVNDTTITVAGTYYFSFQYRTDTQQLTKVYGPSTTPQSQAGINALFSDSTVPVSGNCSIACTAGASGTGGSTGGVGGHTGGGGRISF